MGEESGSTGEPVEPGGLCGNFIVDPGEACDDGNVDAGDGCTPQCQYDDSVTCGDGVLEAPERCDDGNLVAGDGCEPSCNYTPGRLLWERRYQSAGKGNGDEGHGVAVDSKGSIIAAGTTWNLPENPGREAAWLRKFTPDGDIVWTQLHMSGEDGPFAYDQVQAIAVDSEDSLLVSGVVTTPGQSLDLWVAKYGYGSPLQWELTRDGPGGGGYDFDKGLGIAVGPDDHAVAVGQFGIDGDIQLDWWIGKFAPSGESVWEMTVTAPSYDIASAVAIDGTGGIVVVGMVGTVDGYVGEAHLRYYEPDGQLVWDRVGLEKGAINAVAFDPGDDILATGYVDHWEGNSEVWIGRYSPEGDELWTRVQATPEEGSDFPADLGRGLAVDASGNFAVYTGGSGWIGKFSAAGELLWAWSNSVDLGDYAGDVEFDAQGYLAAVGTALPAQREIVVRRFVP